MREKFRDNLFYIGLLIMSLTLFAEHLFSVENNLTCFLKGAACGLELVGIIVMLKNKNKKKN